jgi:hypothetical protein
MWSVILKRDSRWRRPNAHVHRSLLPRLTMIGLGRQPRISDLTQWEYLLIAMFEGVLPPLEYLTESHGEDRSCIQLWERAMPVGATRARLA